MFQGSTGGTTEIDENEPKPNDISLSDFEDHEDHSLNDHTANSSSDGYVRVYTVNNQQRVYYYYYF